MALVLVKKIKMENVNVTLNEDFTLCGLNEDFVLCGLNEDFVLCGLSEDFMLCELMVSMSLTCF